MVLRVNFYKKQKCKQSKKLNVINILAKRKMQSADYVQFNLICSYNTNRHAKILDNVTMHNLLIASYVKLKYTRADPK